MLLQPSTMMFQPPTLIAMALVAIVIASLAAMFFSYVTGEGPAS